MKDIPSYLFPYQKDMVKFALERERVIVGDEMGLGKTVESIAFCSYLKLKTIIICPKTLITHWAEHVEKFANSSPFILTTDIKLSQEEIHKKLEDSRFTIMNYDILKKFSQILKYIDFDCVILDEAHYIKNYKAKRTKIIIQTFDKCKYKLLLTGTPIKNRPADLFQLLNFIDKRSFPSFFRYAMEFCDPKQIQIGFKTVWDFSGASNLDKLGKILRNYMIRRKKEEVQKFLPEKQRIFQPLDWYNEKLKKEYEKAEIDFLGWLAKIDIEKMTRAQRAKVLTKISYLKQITTKDKIYYLQDLLTEYMRNGEKYVIFSQYKSAIRELYEKFKDCSSILTGDIKDKDRNREIKKFNEDDNIKFLFSTTQVGGLGISLTSASTVIFLDMLWTPADHDQAESRVHRFGQTKNVQIYYLYIKRTIDEKILSLVRWKEDITKQTIDLEDILKTLRR
ncbi:MAG: DEAD/DEAH box helicase [Candidatus Heimdallarchaeaceae archaeon]